MSTLYEVNKESLKKAPPIPKDKIHTVVEDLNEFINNTKNKRYLLLDHDRRNYTMFEKGKKNGKSGQEVVNELLEYRQEDIIEAHEENGAFEIWTRPQPLLVTKDMKASEVYCYYFFPFDSFVIKF